MAEQDEWIRWSNFVLKGIESLSEGQDKLREEFFNLRKEIANRGAEQEKDWNNKLNDVYSTLNENNQRIATLEEMSKTNKWAWRFIIVGVITGLLSGVFSLAVSLMKSNPPPPRVQTIERRPQEIPRNTG